MWESPIPSLPQGQGGAIEGPADTLWGRTSEQTGGPGRQAAENRPWECLSVHDSAEPGGGAGVDTGEGAQQLPRAFGHSALGGNNLTPVHIPLVHIEEGAWGPGHWVGGFKDGGGGQSKYHRPQWEGAQGDCPAPAAELYQWGSVAGPTGGFLSGHWVQPCLHWFSGAWSPSTAGELHLGPLCNCPAGQFPPGSHLGPRPGLGSAWTGKRMGCAEGRASQWRWPRLVHPEPHRCLPPGLRVPGCPRGVLVPGGAFWAQRQPGASS